MSDIRKYQVIIPVTTYEKRTVYARSEWQAKELASAEAPENASVSSDWMVNEIVEQNPPAPQKMYYTPLQTVSGKLAHLRLDDATRFAQLNNTIVLDEDGYTVWPEDDGVYRD